ncbi:DUF1127 domain-containing protein [Bradyrhizobium betae]|uniref:YjiS-like domain-containing protein n=1 Tax=Bradyrhizobium betae TaxID=244734 RepID=A0A4Q1V605_9BRAD|nr:DUF1127 domain-containing protein [Bradyrhizobium betae]RXT45684.1 hypothetical protein B5V03_18595 [Bradyrhizobium betae]
MKPQSRSVARVVRLSVAEPDGAGRLVRFDDGGLVRPGSGRSTMPGVADIGSHPDAGPERDTGTFWWALAFSLMEGFALYGAALHPTAAMPVHAILAATRDRQPADAGEPPQRARSSSGAEAESTGNVVEFDRVRPRDAQPERHWTWLRAAGETVSALTAQLRREREIRRAIAALKDLDDRTLRDLGIRGRSEIEWTVRYCHDC